MNRVRTRYRYLNIDVSGSLNGVRNLDFHGIRDVNGNLNRSRRNVHDSFNRVWDIDKNLNFPGDSNTNRDGYFLIKVLVHFNVVRNIYAHFDRYGYVDRYVDIVGNCDLDLIRYLDVIRNGNLNFHWDRYLVSDRHLDSDFNRVRTSNLLFNCIGNRNINVLVKGTFNVLLADTFNFYLLKYFDGNVLNLFNININVKRSLNNLFLTNGNVVSDNYFNRDANRNSDIIRLGNLYLIRDRYLNLLINIGVAVLVNRLRCILLKLLKLLQWLYKLLLANKCWYDTGDRGDRGDTGDRRSCRINQTRLGLYGLSTNSKD